MDKYLMLEVGIFFPGEGGRYTNSIKKKNWVSGRGDVAMSHPFESAPEDVQRYAIIIIINSFLGDDVLDNFIMAYRDEDSILDQIYEKLLFSTFKYEDLKIL